MSRGLPDGEDAHAFLHHVVASWDDILSSSAFAWMRDRPKYPDVRFVGKHLERFVDAWRDTVEREADRASVDARRAEVEEALEAKWAVEMGRSRLREARRVVADKWMSEMRARWEVHPMKRFIDCEVKGRETHIRFQLPDKWWRDTVHRAWFGRVVAIADEAVNRGLDWQSLAPGNGPDAVSDILREMHPDVEAYYFGEQSDDEEEMDAS